MSASEEKVGAWTLFRYLPRVMPYLRPYWKLGIGSLGTTALLAAFAVATPWPLAIMIDSVLGEKPAPDIIPGFLSDGKYGLLIFAASFGFVVALISNAVTVLDHYINAKLEQWMVLDFRSDLFYQAQRLSLTYHDRVLAGTMMFRVNYAASAVGSIVMVAPPLLQSVLTLVGMFVVAFLIDPLLAVLAITVVPFIYWCVSLYGKRIVPRLQRVQGLEVQSLSIVAEAMSMLRVIVPFNRERHEYLRFRLQGETAVAERIRLTVRQTFFSLGVNSFTAAGSGLVFGVGAYRALNGDISVGELLVVMSYVASIYQPLEQISSTVGTINDSLVAFRASLEMLDEQPDIDERPDARRLERAQGAVAFEDVSFSYEGRNDTLKNVSFHVEPGERVAVVGPTGAGKTTIINLLVRFYDPKSGRIAIDGSDIRDLTLESLRAQISIVPQEPLLFSGTIADNIRYGRLEATDAEIVEAARAANAHDFVSRLPQGYGTPLGEGGAQLSGGERQRICVARAFLKDAPILILDEPTSSIDSRTEGVILDALEELMEGRTSFMIAHRLSTVREADRILVVSDGEVVEQGSHDELHEAGGLYRALVDAQQQRRRRRPPARVAAEADDLDAARADR